MIQDENNCYFFRALNMEDNEDLKKGKITDEKGNIIKIRTDRQRWIENNKNSKYDENSKLSLEEICDHIKENYRRDTNCISLSCNPRISLKYGKSYTEKYVMITIPKSEIGTTVVNAEKYILEKASRKTKEIIEIAKRARDSEEFIHYGEIESDKIIEIPKQVMGIIALLAKQ